jgi:hypothetical protein
MRNDEKTTTTIIPAAPGWYLGEIIGDRKEIEEATSLDNHRVGDRADAGHLATVFRS